MSEPEETPLKNYLLFGMPRISTSIVLTIVDFCILFLYFEGYGLSSLYVGLSAMAGKFAIAISQSFLGWLSDKTKTRFGKRKPYMIFGSPLLAISFTFLLLPTVFLGSNPGDIPMFLWLLIWDVIFQFSYGITTPYQSWMAEQFKVNERPKASAFQNIFNYVGTGIAMLFVLLLVPDILEDYQVTKIIAPLFIMLVILFSIIVIALFNLSAFTLPIEKAPPIRMNFIKDVKELIVEDRNFINVCVMVGIASLTWSMITGIMLGYVEKVLNFSSILLPAVFLALGVVGSLFAWKKAIDKFGKKKTLTIIFLWGICTLPFAAILPLMPFEDFTVPALILVVIVSAALGGWFLFPYIVYSDLAENCEKKTQKNELKAGLYNGFPSILLNIFQAFGWLMNGIFLLLPIVPDRSYSWGYLIWAPIGSVILIIAFLFTRKFVTLDFEWENELKS